MRVDFWGWDLPSCWQLYIVMAKAGLEVDPEAQVAHSARHGSGTGLTTCVSFAAHTHSLFTVHPNKARPTRRVELHLRCGVAVGAAKGHEDGLINGLVVSRLKACIQAQ